MELTTKRETVYGGPLTRRRAQQYFVYLNGQRIASDPDKATAQTKAKQALADAYEYQFHASIVRVANDGSVIVFRQMSSDTAVYEYHRNNKSSGSCMGRMTSGDQTFKTMAEYTDYIVNHYNGANS